MSRRRHEKAAGDIREQKRRQFASKTRRASHSWIALAALTVAVGTFIGFALVRGGGADESGFPGGVQSPAAGRTTATAEGQIRLALADLGDGQAKFYEHPAADGRTIRFFALRGRDGVYRAALDACEICYHAKKGYYQRGDQMVCRQCGNSYAPALIDESPGGCHPMALPRSVEGGHLVVAAADIERVDAHLASQPPPRRPMRRGW